MIIGNGRLITNSDKVGFMDNGAVLVKDNVIVEVGNFEESTNEGFYKKPDGTYLFRIGKDIVEYKKGGNNIPKQYINMLEQLEEKYSYYIIENIVERPFV